LVAAWTAVKVDIHPAADGAAVVVNCANSKSGADAVVARINEKGGKAIAVQGDVSLPQDIQRLFSETKKAYKKLDILVNNAGMYESSSALPMMRRR
jgi:3-oxoacyl-[acyl-carrier protein] reductase